MQSGENSERLRPSPIPRELAIERIEAEVKKFLGGKWFAPLLIEIGVLELSNPQEFSDFGVALEDAAPDWSFNCLLKGVTSAAETPFGVRPDQFGSREFGLLLGMKWSVLAGFGSSHGVLKQLNRKQVEKIESVWGAGTVAMQVALAGEVWAKQLPEMRRIKRRAQELAEAQGEMEESEFLQGLSAGVTYLKTLAEKMRAMSIPDEKATDEQKRNLVHCYGALFGPELETRKGEASWPQIFEEVSEMADHQVEFDEDTVKKILQRTGLTGVGKRGQPPKK